MLTFVKPFTFLEENIFLSSSLLYDDFLQLYDFYCSKFIEQQYTTTILSSNIRIVSLSYYGRYCVLLLLLVSFSICIYSAYSVVILKFVIALTKKIFFNAIECSNQTATSSTVMGTVFSLCPSLLFELFVFSGFKVVEQILNSISPI